jgi:DNA-binding transcriptional MocR family regulator
MTQTEQIMQAIRTRIASRALATGDRLPSIRRFAQTMGVSPSTVVEAYARLEAEGAIRARRGAGFFVTASELRPLTLGSRTPPSARDVDPFWVSRQSLDAAPGTLKPGCGWLPPDWLPEVALRKELRAVARSADVLLTEYGGAQGSPTLRRLLLARLADEGLTPAADQILLTASGTQAIDLICRLHLRPGDAVIVDDPCYFNFRALLQAHQARIVGVPYTPQGPDLAAFERAVTEEAPRLYLTNTPPHNPTGAGLSPQNAHRVVGLAAAHGVTIVEDDIFGDFEPGPSQRLAPLDGLNRVIRIGSFSKTLSASLRCGFVVAQGDWIERLIDLQIATGFGGPSPVAADVIARVLAGGSYRRHIEALRDRLARARKRTADRMAALGIVPWTMPRAGFYLWCRLPGDLDAAAVARRCAAEDVILAPGNVFSVSGSAASMMRFNVAQMDNPRVVQVLETALADR